MTLDDIIAEKAENEGAYAVAHALLRVAAALKALGNADAATPMGAMEALGDIIYRTGEEIAASLDSIAAKLPDAED
jgi:hypothetical protein